MENAKKNNKNNSFPKKPKANRSTKNRGRSGKVRGSNAQVARSSQQQARSAQQALISARYDARATGRVRNSLSRAVTASASNADFVAKKMIMHSMRAMCDPMSCNPIRWNNGFSSGHTALAKPFYKVDAVWDVAAKYTQAFVFKCPLLACVYMEHPKSGDTLEYQMQTFNNGSFVDNWKVTTVPDEMTFLKSSLAKANTAWQPHGSTVWSGCDLGLPPRYFWMTKDDVVSLALASAGTPTWNIRLYKWAENGPELAYQATVASSATAAFSRDIMSDGYYALAFTTSISTEVTISNAKWRSPTGGAINSVWAHKDFKDLNKNMASTVQLRVIAASLMYSNDSPQMYKEGRIAGVQLPANVSWMNYVDNDDTVRTLKDSVELEAKNGMYGFVRPTAPSDFDWFSHLQRNKAGQITDGCFPIKATASFATISVRVNEEMGMKGRWTFCHGIEYQTTDIWRETGLPEYPKAIFNEATDLIVTVPNFIENPVHIAKIFAAIAKGTKATLSFIGKYGPIVGAAAAKAAEFMN